MSAMVINLDRYRRERDGEPSISAACVLIERTFDQLALTPEVRDHLGLLFGAILMKVVDGDPPAVQAWRRLERVMVAPLRSREPGEAGYQPLVDRLVTIDALARHFQMQQDRAGRLSA